ESGRVRTQPRRSTFLPTASARRASATLRVSMSKSPFDSPVPYGTGSPGCPGLTAPARSLPGALTAGAAILLQSVAKKSPADEQERQCCRQHESDEAVIEHLD